jgi:hypothetical protein
MLARVQAKELAAPWVHGPFPRKLNLPQRPLPVQARDSPRAARSNPLAMENSLLP